MLVMDELDDLIVGARSAFGVTDMYAEIGYGVWFNPIHDKVRGRNNENRERDCIKEREYGMKKSKLGPINKLKHSPCCILRFRAIQAIPQASVLQHSTRQPSGNNHP